MIEVYDPKPLQVGIEAATKSSSKQSERETDRVRYRLLIWIQKEN